MTHPEPTEIKDADAAEAAQPAGDDAAKLGDQTIYVCGINHERAELAIRERFAMDRGRCLEALAEMRHQGLAGEAMVLSTCNRTEIYAAGHANGEFTKQLRAYFLSLGGKEEGEHHTVPLYNYNALEATRHFFAVNAGLNSMILGENEIKGQVRQAFEASKQEGMLGTTLHRFFEGANRCAKRIRTQTDLNTGTLSYGKASVLRAEELLGTIEGKVCLVIGAGKVGRVAAEALAERNPSRLVIINRTPENAAQLAEGIDAETAAIGEIPELIRDAHLVIGAAFAPNFLVTKEMFLAARGESSSESQVCLVDAAVPRILDRGIGELPGVTRLDISDLESIIAINRDKRIQASQRAWEYVEEEMEKFHGRAKAAASVAPVISRLKDRFDKVFSEFLAEMDDAHDGSPNSKKHLYLHRMKQRLLHESITEIKRLNNESDR